jgi:hypothetical protein
MVFSAGAVQRVVVAAPTQIGWGAQTGMARGAVWSRPLSLRHTKIMLINPENLRVEQHVFIGARHVINMCSTARHVFAVRFTRDLRPTASVWRRPHPP